MLTNVSWGRVPAALIYSERQLHLSWYLFLTATGKGMQGKCAEVNKDSSKSLHMSHFCVPGWICCEGEARRRYVSGLLNQIRRPHKLSPVRQISQNTDIQVLSLLMIQKRASYSAWMFIFLRFEQPDTFEISAAIQGLETRERRLNTTGWLGKTDPIWRPFKIPHGCRTIALF